MPARAMKICRRIDIPAVRARTSRWVMNPTSKMRPMAAAATRMSRDHRLLVGGGSPSVMR